MFILELIKYGTCNIYYNQRTTIQKIGRMITSQHEKYSSIEKYAQCMNSQFTETEL